MAVTAMMAVTVTVRAFAFMVRRMVMVVVSGVCRVRICETRIDNATIRYDDRVKVEAGTMALTMRASAHLTSVFLHRTIAYGIHRVRIGKAWITDLTV
jgi:hypothetical protein